MERRPNPERSGIPALTKQWEANVRSLSESGLLSIDTKTKLLGIRGIDGNDYAVPTPADIARELAKHPELAEKIAQGFTKLLLVPFALPLDALTETLGKATVGQYKKNGNKLRSTNGDTLELNLDEPLWAWDAFKNADVNGTLVYDPRQFTTNHGGSTKAQLLQANPNNAWRILLLEENLDVPRQGKGKVVNNRPRIEANKTPREYLDLLKQTPAYQHEHGLTPEMELTHALLTLTNENRVIDDYQGPGSIIYLTGSYVPASGDVPFFCWYRDARRWYLYRNDPGNRYEHCGFRPGVRVNAP